MLARLPSLMIVRLWAVSLLAAIVLQATIPISETSSHAPVGSAFSAATPEVALYVQRGERVQRQVVAPQPVTPVFSPIQPLPTAVAQLTAAHPVRLDATGPPLRRILSWKPAPRAPPRA